MRYLIIITFGFSIYVHAQADSTSYRKKVLDNTELTMIGSFYSQDGNHAAVTGGIGTEKMRDLTTSLILNLPIKEDGVLSIDAGLSAYSSASSSNINPFDVSGASGRGGDDDDDDDGDDEDDGNRASLASPWVESSGASKSDVYSYATISYSHSSHDRNKILSSFVGFSSEYDYRSFNFGLGYAFLFNDKNSTIDVKASAFLDKWKAIYPTELKSYYEVNGNLTQGFFEGQTILPSANYNPSHFTFINDTKRNSFTGSLSFSQILSPSVQMSIFGDIVFQQGLLSTPFHRIYFGDVANYYIGDAAYIPNYADKTNNGVFQLADDREVLPDKRLKFPIGMRLNAYLSDRFILRTYYRFYTDDWNLKSHTLQIELPIKISNVVTLSPMYRYYTQKGLKYFAPYEKHLSTEKYYTSDYDLAPYSANQFGGGLKIAPPFGILNLGKKSYWKSIELRYQYYKRDINYFHASIFTWDFGFVF